MNLHYKEYGDKRAALMVFIHGGGVSGWMWDQQIEFFSSRYHCIVPDLPEQGSSQKGTIFTIDGAAEEIIDLIESVGKGKPVIVIGFSLGAQVLVAMLSQKPNLIDYAMINSALVKPIPFAKPLIKSLMFTYPLIKIKAFSSIQAKSMYIDKDDHDTYYQESSQLHKDAFQRIMNENMSFTIPPSFEHASSNILVTVGEKERKIMKDSMKEITNKNANCKGVIIPKIGHGLSFANPMLFNQILDKWIESNGNLNEVNQTLKA